MRTIFENVPDTYDGFAALLRGGLTEPERTAGLLLLALNLYTKDANAGIRAMDGLRGPRPMTPYDAQFLRDRLRDKPYLPLAYFEGASPKNGYVPSLPPVLDAVRDTQPAPSGYIKLFLKTAGADTPRPVTLRQKGADWFAWEYSSILLGIRIPESQDPWA